MTCSVSLSSRVAEPGFLGYRALSVTTGRQEAASGIFVSRQAVGLVICSEEHLDKCLGWVDFTLFCEGSDLLVGCGLSRLVQ